MIKLSISYTICAAAMLLAACAKDDATPAPVSGVQLSITVTDGGYAPAGGARPASASEQGTAPGAYKVPATRAAGSTAADAPITRAAENGYATEFTTGDRCGLYIVRGGAVTAANVRLTASAGQNGAVAWTPDASAGTLWHTPGDRYFVYYPWQAAPQDAPTAGQTFDAADDAAFFAALIASWSPAANQSDYAAGYTASDLMTAEATVGNSAGGSVPLSFSMTHRMALVVVELPGTISLDGTIESVTAAFSGEVQPCRMADHTYRYLVNPAAATAPTLEGSYNNGTHRVFSIYPADIAGGSYKTYKVDGGMIREKAVQAGDYFCSDGSYSAELDPKKTVIGIVFQTDPARIGDAEKEALKAKGVTAPRGLVMAVKNAAKGVQWGPVGWQENLLNCESPEQNNDDNSGYGNCAQIRTSYSNFENYPAFKAADDYNTTCPAPAATTGWYLPATGQWYDILRNLGGLADWDHAEGYGDFVWTGQGDVCAALNRWMSGVTGADLFDATNDFWSSSQFSNINARHWSISSNGEVKCCWDAKEFELGVRPILAF